MYSSDNFAPRQPGHALPQDVASFAYGLATEIGVDANMVALAVIGVSNTLLLGATCDVTTSFRVGSSLYLGIGAPPSAGKTPCVERVRGHCLDIMKKHLLLSEDELQRRVSKRRVLGERSKFVLKKAAKESDAFQHDLLVDEHASLERRIAQIKIPQLPFMGQVSPYALIKELGVRGGVGANIDAEGGLFSTFNSVAIEQLQPILKAWSSEGLTNITKSESYLVEYPTLTLVAFWQDKPLKKFLQDPKYYDVGLVARILPYIAQQATFTRSGEVSPEVEKNFVYVLERIIVCSLNALKQTDGLTFLLSNDAKDCLKRFRAHADFLMSPGQCLCEYPEIAKKMDVQAVKLAMALHALEAFPYQGNEITGDMLQKACELVVFFVDQQRSILGSAQESLLIKDGLPLIDLLIKWGQVNQPGAEFTIDQLRRPIGFSKTKCDKILFGLAQRQAVYKNERFVSYPDGKSVMTEFWRPNVFVLNSLLIQT
ncbi:DUF3987 domain-containing protein [Halodesulfovibrio aestuarii]|uniref:DUF3987 domain-containing protein n=1 Tax=Halodesulfovibrio aestuarii TaxID=126333 RepID=UPI000404D298